MAVDLYVEMDQVLEPLDRRDKGSVDDESEGVLDVQDFQRFLRLG